MLDVGTLVARLTVDMDGFTRDMRTADQQVGRFEQSVQQTATRTDRAFRDSGQSVGRLGTEVSGANRDFDRLGTTASGTARDVGRVGNSANDVRRVGNNARDAETDMRRLARASEDAAESTNSIGEGMQERLAGAFGGIGDLAGQSGDSGGGNFLASFSGKIGGLAGKGGPIAMALVGVAALGLGAGAILANAIADGMEQEKQQDFIQAKLGINEETARRIGIASGASYSNGWGESVKANMDGLAAAMQAGLLGGEEDTKTFQGTIDQLNIVAGLMGEEVPAVARAAGQSIRNGIAKDGVEALDLLAASQRNSLNVSEDLLDSQIEYSTQLRAMGLEGTEGWALVAQGVKGGARDTDVVIDSMKELKLRATDGTAAAAEGFDKLNVNAAEFKTAMNEGGTASRDMIATVLRNLNQITDPVDKNAAALALFGTKFEDIQGAAFKMNLDTAVKEFGDVAGSAQMAGDIMSSNTASSFETAKRSIETSSADIKLALAEAFGPALTDIANWVTTHKPEIISFFTGLADAGFATLDAILAFSSGTLRAFAFIQDGIGNTMGRAVELLGGFQEKVGSIIKHIPGLQGVGEAMEDTGKGVQWYGQQVQDAAGQMRTMADGMDAARPVIQGMRDDVRNAGENASNSARLMQALGSAVVNDIPDSKSIIISDNSPETVKRLQDLGMKVETTPNGIRVTATTDEANTIITSFINQERVISVAMVISERRTAAGVPSDFIGPSAVDNGYYVGRGPSRGGGGTFAGPNADGNIHEPGQATIRTGQGRGFYQWAEAETGWEAFIPGAPSKRPRAERILEETARRFGLGLVRFDDAKPMADGGVVESLEGIAARKFPALLQNGHAFSSYRSDGSTSYHNSGQAADFSNGSGNTDEQLAMANYMADNYQKQLAELIYIDPRFGRCIKDGEFVPDSFYAGAGDHTNHVHVAAKQPLGEPAGSAQAAAPAAPDTRTEREKIADQVIAEGKRRGISDKGIKAAVMTALAETDLQNLDYGMDGDNAGIMQQRDNGGWGTLEDRKDPTRAAGMFYDKLDDFDYNSMSEAEAAQKVQQSGTADGSNYAVKAAEADEIIAASNARGNGQMTVATTDSGAALATDGQRVFVTNWPTSGSSSYTPADTTSTSTPAPEAKPDDTVIWKGAVRVFENGGIRGLPEQAGIYPDGADLVRFAEPGTGGEGYIPLHPAKRRQSLAVTKKIVNGFGFDLVPFEDGGIHGLGGFGGYVGEAPGLKVPTTANGRRAAAYNALAFGVGSAFALASGFDADGNFTGQFDTGANSSAQLEKGFGQVTDELAPILEAILLAIKNREPIRASVNVDQGTGMANIAIMKGGL